MDEGLMIGISVIGIIAVSVTPHIISKIIKYKLEVAKLKSETEIKKEEIRARNQLEIEKMMLKEKVEQKEENNTPTRSRYYEIDEDSCYEQSSKKITRV